jgi:hypothetical protein
MELELQKATTVATSLLRCVPAAAAHAKAMKFRRNQVFFLEFSCESVVAKKTSTCEAIGKVGSLLVAFISS